MEIHVVQSGDTIYSIAEQYGVSTDSLLRNNEIVNFNNLIPGQSIVIVYPEQTYIVQEGDTLQGIANAYGITVMQLLRNNPFLSEREFIYPGETLVISYNAQTNIITNGYAIPHVRRETLIKTLPFLTYLSVFNYRATAEGEIVTYYDDSDIIQLAKNYNVAPLMLLTSLTPTGESNLEVVYNILLNEEFQKRQIDNILNIIQTKGFHGINITFLYMNISNQELYNRFITNLTNRLHPAGYKVFVTINPNITQIENDVIFENVDYSIIGQLVDGVILMDFKWGYNIGPPAPVNSIYQIREFLNYFLSLVPPEKVSVGLPVIGYNWEVPYRDGVTRTYTLSLDAALDLARLMNVPIQFDEISQTPFFEYEEMMAGRLTRHIVWFINARSIDALNKLVIEFGLQGTGVWNIMNYFPQLWLVTNSEFNIVKLDSYHEDP